MSAPLTLIVEGKPLVFDVPVSVGEVIPAGSWYCWRSDDGEIGVKNLLTDIQPLSGSDLTYLAARPPIAPESFADGDVAWVRVEREPEGPWRDSRGDFSFWDDRMTLLDADGSVVLIPRPPRPESLADVLNDANLPDELRARIEKAVGKP